jgi:hypothetical protein
MEREAQREALEAWVRDKEEEFSKSEASTLHNALYAFSELGLWADSNIDSLDLETAIRIWAVVETARHKAFPKELRM